MKKNSDVPTHADAPDDATPADLELDSALRMYAFHFKKANPTAALTDAIMDQVQALRRVESGVIATELQQFLKRISGSPYLQSRLNGSGPPSEFVAQVLHLAGEHGIRLKKGDVYALLKRHIAANDGELSDDQLNNVAAAAAPAPFHFIQATTGLHSNTVSGLGFFSWSFGHLSDRS